MVIILRIIVRIVAINVKFVQDQEKINVKLAEMDFICQGQHVVMQLPYAHRIPKSIRLALLKMLVEVAKIHV